MVLRFLMTTASQVPGLPFQAGQIITVPELTPQMQAWVTEGRAELVADEPETATIGPREQAVLKRGRRK
jgi:hypothetical protein